MRFLMLTSVTGIMGEGEKVTKVPMDMFVDKRREKTERDTNDSNA